MRVQPGEPMLLLDDSAMAASSGVTRTFHTVTKDPANPLLRPDRDWGVKYCIYGSVIHDRKADLFKMWHYGRIVDSVGPDVLYATSKDGIHWNRPALDAANLPNRKVENNTVMASRPGFRFEAQTVLFEPEDETERHYKMLISAEASPWFAQPNYYILYSADGIHFKYGERFGVEEPGYVDVGVLVRDPKTKRYRCYHRAGWVPEGDPQRQVSHPPEKGMWGGRAVAYKESEDLKHWTPSRLIIHADEQDPPGSQSYKLSPFPYGNCWIGTLDYYNPNHEMLWPELAWSRDGVDWERRREPFIPLGRPGEWDRFNNSVATQPLVVGDHLWFYYSGRTERHDHRGGPFWGAIGLARLRLDGFASLDASFDGGTVQTRPFILPEGELFVNTKCDFGQLEVSVLDEDGQPIAGYESLPLKADGVRLPVAWKDGRRLTALKGKTVALRFTLRNARLYAFRVGEGRGLHNLTGPQNLGL